MQHHDNFGVLPSNGGWDQGQWIPTSSGAQTYVFTIDKNGGEKHLWGVGQPGKSPWEQPGCWAYAILPFLEQQNMYDTRTWTAPVQIYICPSRRFPTAEEVVPEDAYGVYNGAGWKWGKTDYAANLLVVPNRPRCLRLAELTDGTSHTIVVGEKAVDPFVNRPSTWYYDEPFFIGGAGGTMRWQGKVLRDALGNDYRFNWGSNHPSGAMFLFGDGSVHMISYGTSPDLVFALMTPSGGEVVPDF